MSDLQGKKKNVMLTLEWLSIKEDSENSFKTNKGKRKKTENILLVCNERKFLKYLILEHMDTFLANF